MVRNFKGVVKVADVQEEFDKLLTTINAKIDEYNAALNVGEDVDYNIGGPDLAPYGYTLSVGGLKTALDALDGCILGANVLRISSGNYVVSEGLYIKDRQVTRLPSKTIQGSGDHIWYNPELDIYTFSSEGGSYISTSSNIEYDEVTGHITFNFTSDDEEGCIYFTVPEQYNISALNNYWRLGFRDDSGNIHAWQAGQKNANCLDVYTSEGEAARVWWGYSNYGSYRKGRTASPGNFDVVDGTLLYHEPGATIVKNDYDSRELNWAEECPIVDKRITYIRLTYTRYSGPGAGNVYAGIANRETSSSLNLKNLRLFTSPDDTEGINFYTRRPGSGILISKINTNRLSRLCNTPEAVNEGIPNYKVRIESKANDWALYAAYMNPDTSQKGVFYSGSAGRNCRINLFDTQVAYHQFHGDRNDSYWEPFNFMFIPKGIGNPYNSLAGETIFANQKFWNYNVERPGR